MADTKVWQAKEVARGLANTLEAGNSPQQHEVFADAYDSGIIDVTHEHGQESFNLTIGEDEFRVVVFDA